MMIGGLLPTLFISRIIFLPLIKWNGGYKKIIFVHFISWLLAGLLAGMGMADGGAFAPIKAMALYATPQFFWLVVDIFLLKRKARKKLAEIPA